MKYQIEFETFTALIVAAIAWVTVHLANARFRADRAMLVLQKVERNGRGDFELTVANIGRRPAFRIALSSADPHFHHHEEGLAVDRRFTVVLPVTASGRLTVKTEYMDADLHPRSSERVVVLEDVPFVEGASLPSPWKAFGLRNGPFNLD